MFWGTGYGGGKAQSTAVFSNIFPPPRVPQTVEDAISVVKELGEQFLWVDAYCIDQNDPAEREHMISNMHHIYVCAVFGTSSDSGLPGVSHILDRALAGILNKISQATGEKFTY
jgi:hypothetical protein